ncbi:MerC domain-containing protein [Novosphingobium sp. Gsoil 351]|uniref:MerC domain-containing protein n=1 Tax=Novosphingobium sp. Gsoil 351 TaxID=2675225 RepID=UPI0012B44379|nr:MerC domain-containing protein [Novosphingobium sp. Gsoil 351]QGN55189.1 MerC family mercury resistance protein [Novosphingobium sp. Gsoil 351]
MAEAFKLMRDRFDRVGILLSGLCAVHCVATLVLVAVLGLGGGFLLNPALHRVGLALAIAVGGIALGLGIARHGRREPLLIGGAGLSLMSLALITGHGPAEAALTIAGVSLVAFAHWRNVRHLSA